MSDGIEYLSGFGNEHATEAVPGVLPQGQNSPQRVAHDLYTEQLSGTAFTAPRSANRRTWMYRRRPSVRHVVDLQPIDSGLLRTAPCRETATPAAQLRWDAIDDHAGEGHTWLSGLHTVATNGDAHLQAGAATHLYAATESMGDEVIVNTDGELLIVPQLGALRLVTELGVLEIAPSEIAVIPTGVKFRVDVLDERASGYVCENYGAALTLPEGGVLGTNTMALARDFLYPTAAYETDRPTRLVLKHGGRLFAADLDHSPLDVVAWHGNNAPYKYDLRRYSPIGSVLFDHPDPSIWTVLTSPSDTAGVANLDFVVFRERWSVAEHTFRPPWFHSNVMSELMGLIDGVYDAKADGFGPGAVSIHNRFLPHGPDRDAYERGIAAELEPVRMEAALAFMLESRYAWIPTEWALHAPTRQHDYAEHWRGLDDRSGL